MAVSLQSVPPLTVEPPDPKPGPPRSALRWFGSKMLLLPNLLAFIPAPGPDTYTKWVEHFAGAAWLTLAKDPCEFEVVNDLDGYLVDFFRVLQDPEKAARLYHLAYFTPYSRQWYEEVKSESGPWSTPAADDVEEAYRFFVVNRMTYSGWSGDRAKSKATWSYSTSLTRKEWTASVSVWINGVEALLPMAERLRTVQVDRLDFRKTLERYDCPSTLHFLDPPYIPDTRVSGGYRHEMTAEDHKDLVRRLLDLQGLALLSGYQHPIYEPLERAGWLRKEFETRIYSSGKRAKKNKRTECLWLSPSLIAALTREKADVLRQPLSLWDAESEAA